MRHVAIVLLALTATAHAEDEDAYFASFPKLSVAAGMTGHGGRLDDRPESGLGAVLEVDYGRGRWQYLAEGSLGTSTVQRTMTTSEGGMRSRGALGMRWLARQFIPFDPLGIELYLRGTAGLEHFRWASDQETRPDLTLGMSFATRAFRRGVFTRIDVDMVFARGDTGVAAGVVLGW